MRKCLSIFLSLVLTFSVILSTESGFSAKAIDVSSNVVGSEVTFGSYPQSRVTDSATLSALNSMGKTWISFHYYVGTGSVSNGGMVQADYMKYADLSYNGNKYRAITFTSYRPYNTGKPCSAVNSCQDDNGYNINTVYYFKYEPLKWRVLDPANGLVICTKAIDSQAFNNYVEYGGYEYWGDKKLTKYANDWANSSLRIWMNGDFYNAAFSSSEKSQLENVTLENSSLGMFSNQGNFRDESIDKVFLLSYNDIINSKYGFSAGAGIPDTARQMKASDYAKCQGCWVNSTTEYNDNALWCIRSVTFSHDIMNITESGSISTNYYCVNNTNNGIVPAIKFRAASTLSSINILSQGNGTATESMIVVNGEEITVKAQAEKGYVFVCWCDESGMVLSNESEYTFIADSDINLVAVFKNSPEVKGVRIDGINIKYKEKSAIIPEIDADEDAEYTVSFESSDPKIVTVDENGNVYGAKRGNATVTCTVADGNGNTYMDSCPVYVSYSPLQWIIMYLLFGWLWY